MNKESFIGWIEDKIHKITYETPYKHLDTEMKHQVWKAYISALIETKNR